MAAVTTSSRILALLLALLSPAAPAAWSASETAPIPAPPPSATAQRTISEKRWHVELAGSSTALGLRETGHDTPAPETEADVGLPWDLDWEETTAWLSLARDILDDTRRSLAIGLRLGATVGRFSAGNEELQFAESWRTSPALSWGLTAGGELRGSPLQGPFLRTRFDYSRASAGEDTESLRSTRTDTPESHRDARFSWHRTDLSFALGWRRGSLAALAGIGYSRFVLLKRLGYRIPIPEEPGQNPFASEIARKLNSRESTYSYRNGGPWSPRLGLEWRPADAWLVAAGCALPGSADCRLAVRMSF